MASADFDKALQISGTQDALSVLATLRTTYASMKKLQGLIGRYTGNLEPEFTTAANALFTVEEITELGTILTKIGALATDLEANHPEAIGL
jgi:hypothetical protein